MALSDDEEAAWAARRRALGDEPRNPLSSQWLEYWGKVHALARAKDAAYAESLTPEEKTDLQETFARLDAKWAERVKSRSDVPSLADIYPEPPAARFRKLSANEVAARLKRTDD